MIVWSLDMTGITIYIYFFYSNTLKKKNTTKLVFNKIWFISDIFGSASRSSEWLRSQIGWQVKKLMWNTASNPSSISYIWCDVFWLSVGSNIGMCCERRRAYAQMKHDLPHRDKDCTHEFRLNPSIECVRLWMISQVKSSASHWQDGQTMIYCSRRAFTVQWVYLESHWKSHTKVTEERRQFWRLELHTGQRSA